MGCHPPWCCCKLLLLVLLRRRRIALLTPREARVILARIRVWVRMFIASRLGRRKGIEMKIEITSKITVEVDLRTTPYTDWPERAKTLARLFIAQEMRKPQGNAFLRESVIARIDAWSEDDNFEL